jgi:hypothetical protein
LHHHLPGDRIDRRLSDRQGKTWFGDRSYTTSCTEVDSSSLSFELNPDSTAVGYVRIITRIFDHAGFGAPIR